MTEKSRNFCVTHNNYTPDHLVLYKHMGCSYIVIGEEVGASGTPHLQITMCYTNARSLSGLIKSLPPGKPHAEVCRDLFASISYCKKEGKWTEAGTAPKDQAAKGKMEVDRWALILSAAKRGRFDEIPAQVMFNQARTVEHIYNCAKRDRTNLTDSMEQNYWLFGASRTGKSRDARTKYPTAYMKMCNKWWDGYDDHDVVIIEDFDIKHDVLCHHLKIWGDRYPFNGEVKGGARKLRPRVVIITSNYHPQQIWQNSADLEPILERFKCIEYMRDYSTPVTLVDAGNKNKHWQPTKASDHMWPFDSTFVERDYIPEPSTLPLTQDDDGTTNGDVDDILILE
jgi:hypothetical protein